MYRGADNYTSVSPELLLLLVASVGASLCEFSVDGSGEGASFSVEGAVVVVVVAEEDGCGLVLDGLGLEGARVGDREDFEELSSLSVSSSVVSSETGSVTGSVVVAVSSVVCVISGAGPTLS